MFPPLKLVWRFTFHYDPRISGQTQMVKLDGRGNQTMGEKRGNGCIIRERFHAKEVSRKAASKISRRGASKISRKRVSRKRGFTQKRFHAKAPRKTQRRHAKAPRKTQSRKIREASACLCVKPDETLSKYLFVNQTAARDSPSLRRAWRGYRPSSSVPAQSLRVWHCS